MPFVDNILQPTHLLLILVVALLVLGPKRLPEAGRALGKGIQGFRAAMAGDDRDLHETGGPTSLRYPQNQPDVAHADELGSQASSVEATQPKESTQPAEPVQPVG